MQLREDAVKAALMQADSRAARLEQAGQPTAAEAAYEAAISTLRVLLAKADEAPSGFFRAMLPLLDTSHPLLIDRVGPDRAGQLRARVATLVDLPVITQIESQDDIQNAIVAAIGIGAPRYNAGDIRGCCTMYWATATALSAAPVFRGFPGYARTLAPLRAILESDVPAAPFDDAGVDALAWRLRQALDAALAVKR